MTAQSKTLILPLLGVPDSGHGASRGDLFYRLSIFPIALPPLRDRREDVPLLVRHFVEQFAQRLNKRIEVIPHPVMDVMKRYSWPGNVRQLQNFIERAVILTCGPALDPPLFECSASTTR